MSLRESREMSNYSSWIEIIKKQTAVLRKWIRRQNGF